jgi:hypothetical protein
MMAATVITDATKARAPIVADFTVTPRIEAMLSAGTPGHK